MHAKEGYISPRKAELIHLNINDVSVELPDLKNIDESKSVAIAKWIVSWLVKDLSSGKIQINNILPSKADFAYRLGVSIGTMQNALRYIEDLGYVESKQCIGTLVKDYNKKSTTIRKLTSKKDLAVESIKNYILSDGFKIGSCLPSSRTISTIIGFSANTTRLALETLCANNIISHKFKNAKESGWVLKTLDFDYTPAKTSKDSQTLVQMVVKDLENYITENLKIGDRIPSHNELSKALKASVKTVHDALKILIDKEILLSRRGRYGTTVIKMPGAAVTQFKPETSIFAPAKDTAFYHYEKTQTHIKKMIAQNYEVGDKLPSILELSKILDLSPNTIRKAFHNLAKEGYLVFSRGRYGGTFVIDIPEVEQQAFKWLAVNPQFAKEYQE
ncbi:GntR family transcriptional regulator [bacterium]|nr:GntR family transcriptional regulator [bacterium]